MKIVSPRVSTFFGTRWLRSLGVELGQSVRLYGLPIASLAEGSSIRIGGNVVLCSNSHYTALGVSRPVILRTLRPQAVIEIGDNCGLSGTVICAAVSVRVGRESMFGADVQVMDTDFHALRIESRRFNNNPDDIPSAPVTIGRNVFVGTRVTIAKGVTIGDNAVIGAGSVVVNDVPPGAIACGNPARVVKQLDPTRG